MNRKLGFNFFGGVALFNVEETHVDDTHITNNNGISTSTSADSDVTSVGGIALQCSRVDCKILFHNSKILHNTAKGGLKTNSKQGNIMANKGGTYFTCGLNVVSFFNVF